MNSNWKLNRAAHVSKLIDTEAQSAVTSIEFNNTFSLECSLVVILFFFSNDHDQNVESEINISSY